MRLVGGRKSREGSLYGSSPSSRKTVLSTWKQRRVFAVGGKFNAWHCVQNRLVLTFYHTQPSSSPAQRSFAQRHVVEWLSLFNRKSSGCGVG